MGLFDAFLGTKKDSGRDAGNAFNLSGQDAEQAQGQLGQFLNYQGSSAALDPLQSSRIATQEVGNNDILGQLYGKGGALSRTNAEEQNLASRGFSLKPEDYEAYGQASDNIAREFGNQGNNLAQMLSDRGLSNSGSAATSFTGLQGNKMEQLGQMQRQIANDRMNTNLQRLGQTRNFLSSLGGQAQNAIEQQYGRQASSEAQNFGEQQAKNNAAYQRLSGVQNASNANLAQRAQTEQQQGWAGLAQGGLQGAQDIGMMYATGGLSGASSAGNGMGGAPAKQLPATAYSASNSYGVA